MHVREHPDGEEQDAVIVDAASAARGFDEMLRGLGTTGLWDMLVASAVTGHPAQPDQAPKGAAVCNKRVRSSDALEIIRKDCEKIW